MTVITITMIAIAIMILVVGPEPLQRNSNCDDPTHASHLLSRVCVPTLGRLLVCSSIAARPWWPSIGCSVTCSGAGSYVQLLDMALLSLTYMADDMGSRPTSAVAGAGFHAAAVAG